MKRPGEMFYGFASNLRDALPNASFIGFTDTTASVKVSASPTSSAARRGRPLKSS